MRKYYLLVSDFDQTLSFNDSGLVLAEMLGIPDFQAKVANLSRLNLVQSGAELTYLLRHDPDFRRVRQDDLIEVGRQIRLKRNIALLAEFLKDGIDGFRFDFYVVSAAPWLVVHSALQGLVPPDHIIGAHFGFSADTAYDPGLIEWLSAADLIVHEATSNPRNSAIHTPYERLAALPEALRARLRLIHYPDDLDLAASVIEPLRQGKLYVV